jgi:hypothetical protein
MEAAIVSLCMHQELSQKMTTGYLKTIRDNGDRKKLDPGEILDGIPGTKLLLLSVERKDDNGRLSITPFYQFLSCPDHSQKIEGVKTYGEIEGAWSVVHNIPLSVVINLSFIALTILIFCK